MPVEIITSLKNPRLKRLVRLRDRRPRDEERAFLVEGYREGRRALEGKVAPDALYYSPGWFLGENEPALLATAAAAGATLFELSKDAFAKVAYRERPDGILAVAPQWRRTLAGLALPAEPLLLVVEAIEKEGELAGLPLPGAPPPPPPPPRPPPLDSGRRAQKGRGPRRPRAARRAPPPCRRGDRKARKPGDDPAQRRRRGLPCRDHVRPGDRPLQP